MAATNRIMPKPITFQMIEMMIAQQREVGIDAEPDDRLGDDAEIDQRAVDEARRR